MPWGCGEQNMVNFAPNIYVLKYLQTVNQLTKQLENKAKQYMVSGWCSYAVDWKKKKKPRTLFYQIKQNCLA